MPGLIRSSPGFTGDLALLLISVAALLVTLAAYAIALVFVVRRITGKHGVKRTVHIVSLLFLLALSALIIGNAIATRNETTYKVYSLTYFIEAAFHFIILVTIPFAYVFAYGFVIVRAIKKRGAKFIALTFLLSILPVLTIWRATSSDKVECLAYAEFDGNKAAVLSRYGNFAEGYYVCLAYRGADDPDWNQHYITHESFLKWRNVRIAYTPIGVLVYTGKERPVEKHNGELLFTPHKLEYKPDHVFDNAGWEGKFKCLLDEIDGKFKVQNDSQTPESVTLEINVVMPGKGSIELSEITVGTTTWHENILKWIGGLIGTLGLLTVCFGRLALRGKGRLREPRK